MDISAADDKEHAVPPLAHDRLPLMKYGGGDDVENDGGDAPTQSEVSPYSPQRKIRLLICQRT